MNARASHVPSPPLPSPWEERACFVGGRRIGYRERGAGPAVLLLHGIASGAGAWERLSVLLAPHCRVIAWDAPGYGESDALIPAMPLASDYADVLHGLADALGLERFVLVGHSLGAMMAAAFVAAWPQRVPGLLLANPAQGYAGADPVARGRARDERVRLLEYLGNEGYAQQRAARLLRPHARAEAVDAVRASMRRLRLPGFAQACAMLAEDHIWRYLPRWQGRTRVLCGDADTITPADGVAALAQRIGAPYRLLANAGHASYLDAPEAFAEAVVELVGKVSPKDGTA